MIDLETIPLVDGDSSGWSITPDSVVAPGPHAGVRCRRRNLRKQCGRSLLCFSRELTGGRVDQVACPIINISTTGVAFEFDEPLNPGTGGAVAYRAVNGRAVHVNCVVRQCRPNDNGRYMIGARFDRKLHELEDKPTHSSVGKEIAPGVRPRKLRDEK
jgi:hypothetical protein